MLAATRQPLARGPIAAGRPAGLALGRTLRAARKPAGRGVATGTASGGFTGDGAPRPPPEALTQQQEQEILTALKGLETRLTSLDTEVQALKGTATPWLWEAVTAVGRFMVGMAAMIFAVMALITYIRCWMA